MSENSTRGTKFSVNPYVAFVILPLSAALGKEMNAVQELLEYVIIVVALRRDK